MRGRSGRGHRRAFLLTAIVAAACSACGSHKDPHDRAAVYQEGQLEADLRRDVGPPTTEQAVDPRAAGICHGLTEPKVERQLTYEIPSAGLNFRIREWFHLRPTSEITFCVDHTGRILRTAFTDIN